MSRAAPEPDRARLPWRRRLWPIAPTLLVVAAVAGLFVNTWDAKTGKLLFFVVLPLVLAIVAAGVSVGGRRGLLTSVGLVALLVYWAWWFGWGLDASVNGFSLNQAVVGISDAAIYEVALFVILWPLVLVVAIVVGGVARKRGRRAWPALGIAALAFVVLSLPVRGTWDDTCNDTIGPGPLVLSPIAQPLMDHGVGAVVSGSQTLALCPGTGDRSWKPFWLGSDGLPPKQQLYGGVAGSMVVPKALYRSPAPLPGRRLSNVSLAYWPERETLYAVVVTDRELARAPRREHPSIDLRIAGVPFDDDEGLGDRAPGASTWCYSVVWVSNPKLPKFRRGTELTVDLEYRGKRLASGRVPVQWLAKDQQIRSMGEKFGCKPMW